LVDIGVNLAHASFRHDRDAVITRACAAGVTTMIVTGTSVPSSRAADVLARTRPGTLFATAGVHPHDARHCDDATIPALRALASERGTVVAIGECGLDFNRDFSPRPVQEQWFESQVALAAELGLPLFLHERDAHARFVEILGRHRASLTGGGVVHCFTGTGAELDAYLAMDLHIGITGWICDERRGTHLRELVRRVPLERLMLETDAPFLAPRDLRPRPHGGRNEPGLLPHVLVVVAECLGRAPAEVAAATTATARRLFRLP
jgi:TatD DNase family protein